MTAAQSVLLTTILSAVLVPILVAVVAIIGLARARKTILVFAIVGLLLYVLTEIGVRSIESGSRVGIPYALVIGAITLSPIAIKIASQLGIVGGILALIHSVHVKRWDWFSALLVAALVTAVGGLLLNSFVIMQVLGSARAFELLGTNAYIILANALYCVSFIAQILYGVFGPAEPASATRGEPAPTTSA